MEKNILYFYIYKFFTIYGGLSNTSIYDATFMITTPSIQLDSVRKSSIAMPRCSQIHIYTIYQTRI